MAKKIKQIEMKMPREPRKITVKKPKEKMSEKIIKKTKSLADVITAVGIIGAAAVGIGTNKKLDTIIEKVDKAELNATRSQLLTLMSDYPDNESEILKVADYYFNELDGDWYMTDLFTKWADSRGIDVTKIVTVKK